MSSNLFNKNDFTEFDVFVTSNVISNDDSLNKKLSLHKKRIETCLSYKQVVDNTVSIIKNKNKHLSDFELNNIIKNHFKNKDPIEWHKMYDSIILESQNKINEIEKMIISKKKNIVNRRRSIIKQNKNINKTKKVINKNKISMISLILLIILGTFFLIMSNMSNNYYNYIKGTFSSNNIDNLTGNSILSYSKYSEKLRYKTDGLYSSYGTKIKIIDKDISPLGTRITYDVYNDKNISVAYIVASPKVKLTIHGNELVSIGKTVDFKKDWEVGFLSPIRKKLSRFTETNITKTIPKNIRPKKGEELLVYEYPHKKNTWANIVAEGPSKGKVIFLDPAISWWNSSWKYKQEINITNNQNINFTNRLITLYLNSSLVGNNFNWSTINNSIRFTYFNRSNNSEKNIDFWIQEWDDILKTAKIWVKVDYISSNMTNSGGANGTSYINMYYDNPSVTSTSNKTTTFDSIITENAVYNSSLGAPDCDSHTSTCVATSSLLQCNDNQGSPGPEPNAPNTIDGCADSSTSGTCHSDESVENITITGLNGTAIKTGDTINITATLYCYSNADYVGIFFTDDATSPSWNKLTSSGITCSGSGYETFSVTKIITSNNIKQAVRAVNKYNSDLSSACDTGNYIDKDDLAFNIISPINVTKSFGQELNNGFIISNITAPLNNSQEYKSQTFLLNSSVICSVGDCGNTNASLEFLSIVSPTYVWTETNDDDFNSYNESKNISIKNNELRLRVNTPYDDWWNDNYYYRFFFNTSNILSNYDNYYLLLKLNSTNTGNNFVWNNNDSLRIYNPSQRLLDFDIINWSSSTKNASIIVKIPTLTSSQDYLLYFYYNNSQASKTEQQYWTYSETATYNSLWFAPSCNYFTKTCTAPSSLLQCNVNQGSPGPEPNAPNTIDGCLPSGSTGTCHSDESTENITITDLNSSVIKAGDTIRIKVTFYCYNTNDRIGIFYTNDTSNISNTSSVPWQQLTSSNLACSGSGDYETFTVDKVIELGDEISSGSGTIIQAVRGLMKYNSDITSSCPASTYTDADDLVFKVLPNNKFTITNSSEEKHEYLSSGEYISNSFDTTSDNAKFKNISWSSDNNLNTSMKVYTRSSADNITWSSWFQEINNTEIDADNKRYLQYKVELSTTNKNQSPLLKEINSEYEITTIGWNKVTSSSSLSTMNNNPYSCGILNESSGTCNPSWTVVPLQSGVYTLRSITNSSASSYIYDNITISVKEKTYILSYIVTPSVGIANDSIILRVLLVDSSSNPIVNANVTFGDKTNNTFLGSNLTRTDGYAYFTFKIPDSFSLGDHILNSSYSGDQNLYYEKSNEGTTTLRVSSTPKITFQHSEPNITGIGQTIRLFANVTDDVGIDKIWVNITRPDLTEERFFLTNFVGNTYYYDYNNTWKVGLYTFKISANNTDGIIADPQSNFTINISDQIHIEPEKTEYKNYETVNLGNRRIRDWWNSSWLYRSTIDIKGSKSSLNEYQVPLTINTQKLISEGKLNSDCSDLRFISSKNTYQLPVTITNDIGKDLTNYTIKITINDAYIVSHMSGDGSDIRIFNHSTASPYSSSDYLRFWINSIGSGRATIWVKIPKLNIGDSTTIYLYYGDNSETDVSNYSEVFTTPIGIIGKTSASGSFNNTFFNNTVNDSVLTTIFNSSDQPIIISSLMTINDVAEASARVVNITKSNFSVKAEESATLDGIHSSEKIGYLALKEGSWIIGGEPLLVGSINIDNPSGTTYHTITFSTSFSGTPNIFAQTETYNNTDPTHTRQDNPSNSGFDVKLENGDSSDTSKVSEKVGYVALPGGTIKVSSNRSLVVSSLTTTNTYATTHYGSSLTDPALIAKIETENGGDNSHERINELTPAVKVEEEEAADGSHTTETISWLAGDEGIIYGASLDSQPSISVGSEQSLDSKDILLDYYLEDGCNSTNTSVLIQVTTIPPNQTSQIYFYYDNPSATSMSSLEDVMIYDSPQTIGYVVNNNMASNSLVIYSLADDNVVGIDNGFSSLDQHQSASFSSLVIGSEVKASKPIQAESTADNSGTINPSSWANTEFIFFNYRDSDIFDMLSPWGTANVTIYDGPNIVWNGYVGDPGTTISEDINNVNITRIISDIPILVQHRTSSTGDAYSLYPPTNKTLYGLPSNYLLIGTGNDGITININTSGATQIQLVLGSNGTKSYSGLGSDGKAPAYSLTTISSLGIIGALQQADSDGREASVFLPYEQHGTLFGSSLAVETISVASSVENTNCTVYDSSDNIISSQLSSGNSVVSKIGFGTGNDNKFADGGWIMNCDNPVWAYYDRDSGGDENNLFSYPQMKQYYYPAPSASLVNNSEEVVYTGIQNLGDTNISGYLYLAVQTNNSGSWQFISPPVYQDIDLRTISPGTILNISKIWRDSGSWSTSTRNPGYYRVYVALRDPDDNVIIDNNGDSLEDYAEFKIMKSVLKLNNLTHENNYELSLNEYESGDYIDWINITIQAFNNTAINADINLTLINSSGDYPGWGPSSDKSCGNIAPNNYCTRRWNNSVNGGIGYLIPTTIPSGTYTFTWQVNASANNANTIDNNSFTVNIHNVRNTFSSSLNPTRVYTTGDPAYYVFNMTNLWSVALDNISVELNYPESAILNVSCLGGIGNVCYNQTLSSLANLSREFLISANDSSIPGDYYLNVTINYINPKENRSWEQVLPLLLEVRLQGVLALTLYSSPTNITRGSEYDIRVFVNNTATSSSTNPYINFTIPSDWQNITSLLVSNGSLESNKIMWNNLTINTSLSTSLGHKQLLVESRSDQGQHDFKYFYIDVYANTSLIASVNDTNVSRGEQVDLIGQLLYDNGNPVSGETIHFYDVTDNIDYGSAITNSTGYAIKTITIPDTASLSSHLINITYSGSDSTFIRLSNDTTPLDVGLKPIINSLWADPNPQGMGGNVTIYANVTDDDTIVSVIADILLPNSTTRTLPLTLSGGLYSALFNNTWLNGTYNITIVVKDNTGSISESSITFKTELNAFINIDTLQNSYSQNKIVDLVINDAGWWFNKSWSYKQIINLTSEEITNAYTNFTINTSYLISQGKMNDDCKDIRLFDNNNQPIIFTIDNCNTNHTSINFIANFTKNISTNKTNLLLQLFYGANITVSGINVSSIYQGKAYVLSNVLGTANLYVSALFDSTNICLHNDSDTAVVDCSLIDQSEIKTYAANNINATTYFTFNKPIESGFDYTGSGSPMTPIGFAGRLFSYPAPRGTDVLDIIAPYSSTSSSSNSINSSITNVKIFDSTATLIADINLSQGEHTNVSYNYADNTGLWIVSNLSVIVHYEDPTTNYDFMPLKPITKELYGILGASASYDQLSCYYNNTGITVYYTNGTIRTFVCDQGDSIALGAGTSQGQGPGVYVIANRTSIGGMQVADSDGGEGETWLPLKDLDYEYVIPQDAEYISVLPIESSTKCVLYSNTGSILSSQTSTSHSFPRPQDVIRFTGTPIHAGARIVCNATVYAYYEFNDENAETVLLGRETYLNKPFFLQVNKSSEFVKGSLLSNIGGSDLFGYLKMFIEENSTGSWLTKEVLLDDSLTNNLRKINKRSYLDLSSLWPSWNTGNNPAGNYRAKITLNDDKGFTLLTTIYPYDFISDTSFFNITPPNIKLNISGMRIYDVTSTLNKHTYTGSLIDSGLNKTTILESGKIYRFEFDIDTLSSSDQWIINNSNITQLNLNPGWNISTSLLPTDIWYKNESDSSERNSGIWDGNVTWNSSLGGVANNGTTTTFYYVINLSNAYAEERQLDFNINDPLFYLEDKSIVRIVVPDSTPPKIFNGSFIDSNTNYNSTYYNLTNNNFSSQTELQILSIPKFNEIIRGNNFTVFARWNEEINNATISYNGTLTTLQTDNLLLSSPNDQNWTNSTLTTNSLWIIGRHVSKIKASDLLDNWNNTLSYLNFYIFGVSKLDQEIISNSTPKIGDSIIINCKVIDVTDSNNPIQNYLVTFFNGTSVLGTNFTNSSGWAKYSFVDDTPGDEQIGCNITDDLSDYYYSSIQNNDSLIITTTESIPPTYSGQTGPLLVHKGDYVDLSVLWTDNYLLSEATLVTNSSGSYQNITTMNLNGDNDWANFSYQISTTLLPGTLGWYQWANDSSGNINITTIDNIEVWGWSGVDQINLNPSIIKSGNSTNISCKIIDMNDSTPLYNYLVTFFNGTSVLGTNFTNSSGWAKYTYIDNSLGQEQISCEISDDSLKKYNVSENTKSIILNTVSGSDIFPPVIINNNYGLNDSTIIKGESIKIFSEWNESINSSRAFYNSTSNDIDSVNISSPFTNNWVNYTMITNNSWLVGVHYIKLSATDQNGNINDTLPYKNFTLTATSRVNWISPVNDQLPGTTDLICKVSEEENSQSLSDYTVYFYNGSGSLLGTSNTNSTGYANIDVDTSSYNGSYDFSCRIFSNPARYYYIGSNFQDSKSIYFDSSLPIITLEDPKNYDNVTSSIVTFNITATDDRSTTMDCNLTIDGVDSSFIINNGVTKSIVKTVSVDYHYWNVTCIDDIGHIGHSDNYEFNVTIPDSTPPNITMIYPANNYLIGSSSINFTYNISDESDIINCSLYLDDDLNKTDYSVNKSLDGMFVSNIPDGNHNWYLVCFDIGHNKNITSSKSFIVDTMSPSSFNLSSPENFTVTKKLDATFVWEHSSDLHFDNYTIQLSFDKSFSDIIATYYSFSISKTDVNINLLPNNEYYWRVIAYDSADNYRISNNYYTYITDYSSPEVSLVYPGPGAYEPDSNITFSFDVNDYNISSCSLYTNISGWSVLSTNNSPIVGRNYFNITGLPVNTTILWNVYCNDSVDNGAFALHNRTLYIGSIAYFNNQTIPVNLTVNNSEPTAVVIMDSAVSLLAGTTTRVNCSSNVTDLNGFADVTKVNATFYANGHESDINNKSYYYSNDSCVCNVLNSTTKSCVCSFDIEYYSIPGTWICKVIPYDSNSGHIGSTTTLVNTLRALTVQEHVIDYGSLSTGAISNESNITVINLGNTPIDLSLYAYGFTSDDGDAMNCTNGVIPASYERFGLTPSLSYDAMTIISGSSSSRTLADISLPKQINDSSNSTTRLYWRLKVPPSAQGECNGNVLIQAEADS